MFYAGGHWENFNPKINSFISLSGTKFLSEQGDGAICLPGMTASLPAAGYLSVAYSSPRISLFLRTMWFTCLKYKVLGPKPGGSASDIQAVT